MIPYYNPLRLAGEIGMADILTGGRLEIGVGRGAFEYEFDRFGIDEHIAARGCATAWPSCKGSSRRMTSPTG